MKYVKRLLPILISILMVVSIMPSNVFAYEYTETECPYASRHGDPGYSDVTQGDVKMPTCTENGYYETICIYCGHSDRVSTPSFGGHSWDGGVPVREATCYQEGSVLYTCNECYETKYESIPALDHIFGGWTTWQEANCYQQGIRVGYCQICNEAEYEYTPIKEHQYAEGRVIQEMTDSQPEITERICSVCNYTDHTETYPEYTLERGSEGIAVYVLEKLLYDLGYYTGDIDGSFGPMMEQAVIAYNASIGINSSKAMPTIFVSLAAKLLGKEYDVNDNSDENKNKYFIYIDKDLIEKWLSENGDKMITLELNPSEGDCDTPQVRMELSDALLEIEGIGYIGVTELPIPAKPGYIFVGWKAADGSFGYVLEVEEEEKLSSAGDVLEAQWEETENALVSDGFAIDFGADFSTKALMADFDDWLYCEFCGAHRWDEWVCEGGDHCSSEDFECYSSHHCGSCEECDDGSNFCYECLLCLDCAKDAGLHCQECDDCLIDKGGCENCGRCPDCIDQWCDYCEMCYECAQDDGVHCSDCGECTEDEGTCVMCGECFECSPRCEAECVDVCLDCHIENGAACEYCGACFVSGDIQKCPGNCGLCMNCVDDSWCEECGTCIDCAIEDGKHCPDCEICVAEEEHCAACGKCYECEEPCDNGCPDLCLSCHLDFGVACEECKSCNVFDQLEMCLGGCGYCNECADDWCDDCHMCKECAISYGCHCQECGECLVDKEGCEECHLCNNCVDEWCSTCQMCVDCATNNNKHCPDCGTCTQEEGGCLNCGRCFGCGDQCLDECEDICLICHLEDNACCENCGACNIHGQTPMCPGGCGYCEICVSDNWCYECNMCSACAMDAGKHCKDCGACPSDVATCLACGRCFDCGGTCSDECIDACLQCHYDNGVACENCGACFVHDYATECLGKCGVCSNCADNFCFDCNMCLDCGVSNAVACPDCGTCTADFGCYECGRCFDCGGMCADECEDMCLICHVDHGMACENCGACNQYGDKVFCKGECGYCSECAFDWCDECEMCIDCAISNNLHCPDCEVCLADEKYCQDCYKCENCATLCASCEEHCEECAYMCPSCGLCENCVTICQLCGAYCDNCANVCGDCGACENCVQICTICGDKCSAHADICQDCGECESCADICKHCGEYCSDCVPQCQYCNLCEKCLYLYSDTQLCTKCGVTCSDCVKQCITCGVCAECAEMCVNEYCNFCKECCAANSLEAGCEHGVCINGNDWEDHWANEHSGQEHTHIYNVYDYDDAEHWQVCQVGKCTESLDHEKHIMGEWVVITEPTSTTYGYEKKSCSVCDYYDLIKLDPVYTCKYCGGKSDVKSICKHCNEVCDECAELWCENCESCDECATVCKNEDKCSNCSKICKNEYCGYCVDCCKANSAAAGCEHGVCIYGDEWDDHWAEKHGGNDHTHVYNEYSYDDNEHWQVCQVGYCTESLDHEEHIMGEWVVVTQPTPFKAGKRKMSCKVCDFYELEDVAFTSKTTEDKTLTPEDGGTTPPSTDGGAATPSTSDGSGTTPPSTDGGAATPSTSDGSAITPSEDGNFAAETLKIGDIIVFGHYEQDNDLENGKEPVEWKILDIQGEKALIISKYALDCLSYNEAKEETTWETSSIRTWLNDEFMEEAFSATEQEIILTTDVKAEKNGAYETSAGEDTEDKIFLLSTAETDKYFEQKSDADCKPTDYAIEKGASEDEEIKTDSEKGSTWWWTRTPGSDSMNAALIAAGGILYNAGDSVDNAFAVRPAMWIIIK